MKAIFAGSLQGGNVVDSARRLGQAGFEVVAVNAPSVQALLKQAGVAHREESRPWALPPLVCRKDAGISLVVAAIGGSSKVPANASTHALIRAAASCHDHVAVIVDPTDLPWVSEKLCNGAAAAAAGGLDEHERRALASKALRATSAADDELATDLSQPVVAVAGTPRGATVMVIGSGGREHAMALKLADSPSVSRVIVAPGNGGTGAGGGHPKLSNAAGVAVSDHAAVVALAAREAVDLVAVGPEVPLVAGLADDLAKAGVRCFGPSAAAARLEASKAWSKDFMARHGIRTARYANFTEFEAAKAHVLAADYPVVVKASGLAAGKGVLMPRSKEEAVAAVESVMVQKAFGEAGSEVVVEEFLEGEEVSVLALCDGKTAVCMPGAQDHKRALDGDEGPNTGGMGAYAPAPCLTPRLREECEAICRATVAAMAAEGAPFVGVIFAGFMLTPKDGPVVLEFNVRMGDPETQAVLPLMESDLYAAMSACVDGRLAACPVRFKPGAAAAATVVLAAGGYPDKYPKGMPITGVEAAEALPGVTVYHAGTKEPPGGGGGVVSSGGRVLAVTGVGAGIEEALDRAYAGVEKVRFDPMHFRRDIGRRAREAPLRIGVLASGGATALQPVLDAVAAGGLAATVAMLVSNRSKAPALERAAAHGVAGRFVSSKGLSREAFDEQVSEVLEGEGVQLVLLVGYMRILSGAFCERWAGRCLNVHPSLLPDFAGGMDLEVHKAVIAAGRKVSGCTVHQVTEEVDGGPIVVQEEVTVDEGETPESLKSKVQAKEGPAFIEAIGKFMRGELGAGAKGKTPPNAGVSYKDAGVDIDAGNDLVERIKPACKSTRRPGCDADLGGFGGLFDLSAAGYAAADTILVGATDGVGTKLKVAQQVGYHSGVGVDLVAMSVNDLIVAGAEPLFFLDYYATGRLAVAEAAAVVEGIAEGCRQAGCGLIGGETAEMPSMYPPGEYDLAGFAVGAVRKGAVLPRPLAAGDVILGLPSSGVHSNGFSLVRRIIEVQGLTYMDPAPFAGGGGGGGGEDGKPVTTLAEALLVPTKIYVRAVMPLVKAGLCKALAHITGGGLPENLPRVLGPDQAAVVDVAASGWKLPAVFRWLRDAGNLPQEELLRTLNCGVGMCVVVAAEKAEGALASLAAAGEAPMVLGKIEPRAGPDAPQVVVRGVLE